MADATIIKYGRSDDMENAKITQRAVHMLSDVAILFGKMHFVLDLTFHGCVFQDSLVCHVFHFTENH